MVKLRYNYQNYTLDDPRITETYVDRAEPTRGILPYYQQADVLLALGSEGFGLPLVEGMATGLPVIVLDAAGQADVVADAAGAVLPVHPVATKQDKAAGGEHGDPAAPRGRSAALGGRQPQRSPRARPCGVGVGAPVANVWAKGAAVIDLIER